MKRIVLILAPLILGWNSCLTAQNINLGESELKSVLCQQWGIDFAMLGEMKIKQIPGATDFDFKFKSDGTYSIIAETGETKSGNWTFHPKGKYVELEINGTITSRIESISENKLILVMTPDDSGPSGMPKVETHFKPVK